VARAPNFLRSAFFNAYNMSLLLGAGAVAFATGDWTIAAGAVALEAIWLALGPDLKPFQRAVLAAERKEKEAAERKQLDVVIRQLPEREWQRGKALSDLKAEIERDMQHNPTFEAVLLQSEIDKLTQLHHSFVMLAVAATRAETYLYATSLKEVESQLNSQRQQLEKAVDPSIRELAQKNANVLQRRVDTVKEIERFVARARGQMTLIENSVRLLRDQALTMTRPAQLTEQLDDLITGVDAIAQSAKETEAILENRFEPIAAIGEEMPAPRSGDKIR
jgi:hypothetical protein